MQVLPDLCEYSLWEEEADPEGWSAAPVKKAVFPDLSQEIEESAPVSV